MPDIQKLSKADETKARALLARVDGLLDKARTGREELGRTYVDIGIGLEEVQASRAWILVAHSFDSYIKEHCEPRFNRKRNQLYAYKSAAENLLPHFTREQLVSMGVTKAIALSGYVKEVGGKKPPETLYAAAINPDVKVEDFEVSVADARHIKREPGKWRVFKIWATDEEWAEIETAMAAALAHAQLGPDKSESTLQKVALIRMSQECISSWPCTENV